MAVEVTDVGIEKQSAFAPSDELSEERTETLQQQPQPPAAVAALRGRGRPPGSKDRQPRKRQAPLARREDLEEEEEEAE